MVTTAWLRLPDLPLQLYDAGFIEATVSTCGTYLDVDVRTKAWLSLKFAIVCMELDVTRKIPNAVWVNLPNEQGFWQKIELESKLSYCAKCKVHEHELANCRKVLKRNEGRQASQASRVYMERRQQQSTQPMGQNKSREDLAAPITTKASGANKDRSHLQTEKQGDTRESKTEKDPNQNEGWTVVKKRNVVWFVNDTSKERAQEKTSTSTLVAEQDNARHMQILRQYKLKKLPVSIPLAPDDEEEDDSNNQQNSQKLNEGAGQTPTKNEENKLQVVLYMIQDDNFPSQ